MSLNLDTMTDAEVAAFFAGLPEVDFDAYEVAYRSAPVSLNRIAHLVSLETGRRATRRALALSAAIVGIEQHGKL